MTTLIALAENSDDMTWCFSIVSAQQALREVDSSSKDLRLSCYGHQELTIEVSYSAIHARRLLEIRSRVVHDFWYLTPLS